MDIASLEMTPAAMAQRAVADLNMRRGDMIEDQMRAVVELGQSVVNLPIIFLSRPCSNVDAFVSGVRQIARANPCRPGRLHLAHTKALKAGRDAAAVLADARMYFESRTGRQRAALAGWRSPPGKNLITI